MPRSRTIQPKYRRYRPKNLAVVRLDGRDFYLGRYDSPESHELYHRLVAEWLRLGRQLPRDFELADLDKAPETRATAPQEATPSPLASDSGSGPTINELILRYWRFAEGYYRKDGRPTPELTCIKEALRPLRQLYGSTAAERFGPRALKALQQDVVRRGKWCRSTINKHVGRIKRMFRWAASEELIPVSVHQALLTVPGLRQGRTAARERAPVKPVRDEWIDAIEPFVSCQVWAMIQLQRYSGMRPGEALIMRTCDINTSHEVWEYHPQRHKTEHHGHEKVIYLGPRCQQILKPWLRADLASYLFQPVEAEAVRNAVRHRARKSPMTPSQTERRPRRSPKKPKRDHYSTSSYYHAVRRACEKVTTMRIQEYMAKNGLRTPPKPVPEELVVRWHPHQLKHNAGTMVRQAFGVETARLVLGHKNLRQAELYAEADQQHAIEAMRKLG